MRLFLSILMCLSLVACAEPDVRYIAIKYEGYKLPKDTSLWLENGTNKLKIMEEDQYIWTGYFRPGDVFSIALIKNNNRVRYLDTIFIDNIDDRQIVCNKDLTSCEEK